MAKEVDVSASLGVDTEVPALQSAVLVLFFGFFFYQWGAANLEGFSVYPFTRDLGEVVSKEDWIRLRAGPFAKVFPLLVVPFALSIVATIALVFLKPRFIPRWVLLVILGLQAVIATSTVLVQVPIQIQLNSGFDRAATIRLISTDFWLRKVPLQVEGAFVLYALWRVVVR
jgi:hypothetical protein